MRLQALIRSPPLAPRGRARDDAAHAPAQLLQAGQQACSQGGTQHALVTFAASVPQLFQLQRRKPQRYCCMQAQRYSFPRPVTQA